MNHAISDAKTYDKAMDLLRAFTKVDRARYKDIISDKEIIYALGILEEHSGIVRIDYKLAKLCADCFMLGVFVSGDAKSGITLSEQEQAARCLQCESIDSNGGVLRCKLKECKYEHKRYKS